MSQILGSEYWISQWQKAADGSRFHEVYPDEKQLWNRSAGAFDTGMGKSGVRETTFLKALRNIGFQASKKKRALDIGSGTGALSVALAEKGILVDALDNSEKMNQVLLEKCEAHQINTINIIAEDFNAFDSAEGTYDLVVGSLNPCLYNPNSFLKMLSLSKDAIVYIGITGGGNRPATEVPREKPLVELITGISPGHNGSNHIIYPLNLLLSMGMNPTVSYVPSYWTREEEPEKAISRLIGQYGYFKDRYPDVENMIHDYVTRCTKDGVFVEHGAGTMGIIACRKQNTRKVK